MKYTLIIFFVLLSLGFLLLGDTLQRDITLLFPSQIDSISYDQGKLLLVSMQKDAGKELLVSMQWEAEQLIDLNTKTAKDNFAKEFYRIFEPRTSIELISYSYKFYSGMSKPDSILYMYSDTMTIRSFWQTSRFADFIKEIQSTNATSILLYIRGWKDSIYTTKYDDPTNAGCALFKIHLKLIPDNNRIYLSIPGKKASTIDYSTNFVNDSKSIESRDKRFHNSKLEQSCTKCHNGLPSSNNSTSMTADCGVCHKALQNGLYVHGPATDPRDCTTCHSWSSEKNAAIVTKGVPDVCYSCHDEKKSAVENSKVQHPVASSCTVCHSPHGSNQKEFLKKDVYRLCLGCHDTHKVNHPVDKHPLRFVKFGENTKEELSCVSCHQPHGSENAALLKASGGSMAVCMQCHQK